MYHVVSICLVDLFGGPLIVGIPFFEWISGVILFFKDDHRLGRDKSRWPEGQFVHPTSPLFSKTRPLFIIACVYVVGCP